MMNIRDLNENGFYPFVDEDGQFYWKFCAELYQDEENSITVPEGAVLVGSSSVSKRPEDNWTIQGL